MRLIDADVENSNLLDFIAEHDTGIQYALEHKDMTMLEDIFFEYFEAQKTAYDVDKVVEQLEKEHEQLYFFSTLKGGRSYGQSIVYGKNLAYQNAIKIVKAGGVNE